jgi:hypothetical protein
MIGKNSIAFGLNFGYMPQALIYLTNEIPDSGR